jgi:hemoglobin-like flavoprotein
MSSSPGVTLSQAQKRLLRDSFESVREYADSVALLFYGRLFELAPQVRPLFKISIREQAEKLMRTLGTVVDALDRFEELRPSLLELGRKHVGYGVEPRHYEILRSALLWAVGQALGAEFDRETRAAWEAMLIAVSQVMLEGAAAQVEH